MRSILLILFAWLPLAALGETFTVPGTAVSFEAPDGFTPLTPEEIAAKYPRGRPPAAVVGNARRTTSIAYDFKAAQKLPPEALPEIKATFEQVFERSVPGLAWKERRIERRGEGAAAREWLVFEMSSYAVDTDIHNLMLITSHQGRMLMFNFNSTKAEFPALEVALRKSIQSIAVPAEPR